MIASLEDFQRFGHLAYYSLAGADKASKEAIRPLLGLLMKTYAEEFDPHEFRWLLHRAEPDVNKQELIVEQIIKQINTVETSSLGRIFDAVASMLGLGSYNHFDAQLPMALEAIAEDSVEEYYEFKLIGKDGQPIQLGLSAMTKQMVADVQTDLPAGLISAKFHNCLAAGLLDMARAARETTGLNTVALSGGVFCNKYLTNRLVKLLKANGFSVLSNKDIPSNDGGVSVGQAAIAAKIVNRNSC
jgi:hydrogenase maturation protein HypF